MSDLAEIEIACQETYQCYQAVFEQAAVGIARVTTDGSLLDVNNRLCLILGYERTELLRCKFNDITYPDDLEASYVYINKLLAGETINSGLEKRYVRKDGSVIWGYLTVSLARKPNGEPDYFISAVQDIQQFKLLEAALRIQEQRVRSVLEASIDGFWVVSAQNGLILETNDIYCKLSGYSREELLTMRVADVDCQETTEEIAAHIHTIMQHGGDVFTSKHRRKNGDIWPVEVTVTYSNIDGGRVFVFLRDIRERYINRALLDLRVRLSDLVHNGTVKELSQLAIDQAEHLTHSQIGFLHFLEADQQTITPQVWSTNTLETFCASQASQHYPISEAGVWVDCVYQRCPVIHNDYATLTHKKGLPEGHPQVIRELTVPILRNGIIVAVLGLGNKAVPYTDDDTKVASTIGDIALDYIERKWADDRVEFMAYYDALTHLPNRTLLLDRIHQAIAQTKRTGSFLVLAYLDLDGFKPVNDRYGHSVGDQFLQAFAQRMSKALRSGDTIARLGGDEFALVLSSLSQAHDGETILWRLLDILSEPFCVAAHEVRVGASIGFTIYPLDNNGPEVLLGHADMAMYQAKWQGKNTVRLYDMAQNARLIMQQETVEEIRQALSGNELELYYQPQVKLTTGEVVAAEASLRWHHPRRGLLVAEEFLPTLYGTQKAARLDEWIIRQVLRQIATWDNAKISLPISVNISYSSLCKENFLIFMRDQAAYWPSEILSKLEIEIAQFTAVTDINTLSTIMVGCVGLGVRFTLDNCESNYAYLSYIRQLPIHKLKLDHKFVNNITENAGNLKLIEKAVGIASECQLSMVAQGVDNLDLAALMVDINCPLAQGASIAQPMPVELLLDWRRTWSLDPRYRNLRSLDPHGTHNALLKVAIRTVQLWSDEVANFIETKGETTCPMLCTDQCHLNNWYNGLGKFRYGTRPGFAFQSARHRALHLLAAELVELVENGLWDKAKTRVPQFFEQCNEIMAMLTRLGDPNV